MQKKLSAIAKMHEENLNKRALKKSADAEEAGESSKEEAEEEGSSGKYSDDAENAISNKMDKMKNEDRPQKQKVAIAISEARQKGLKVPGKK